MQRKFIVTLIIDLDQAQAEGTSTPYCWDWEQLVGPEVTKAVVLPVEGAGTTLHYDAKTNVITGIGAA